MSTSRSLPSLPSPGPVSAVRRRIASGYVALVTPVGPRGALRTAGAAGIAEGVFLLLISFVAPVGTLALLTLVAGEVAFVASFAPTRE